MVHSFGFGELSMTDCFVAMVFGKSLSVGVKFNINADDHLNIRSESLRYCG